MPANLWLESFNTYTVNIVITYTYICRWSYLVLYSPPQYQVSYRMRLSFSHTSWKQILNIFSQEERLNPDFNLLPSETKTNQSKKERDKHDCRDVMGARQTSGLSACGRVELILNKLWKLI